MNCCLCDQDLTDQRSWTWGAFHPVCTTCSILLDRLLKAHPEMKDVVDKDSIKKVPCMRCGGDGVEEVDSPGIYNACLICNGLGYGYGVKSPLEQLAEQAE